MPRAPFDSEVGTMRTSHTISTSAYLYPSMMKSTLTNMGARCDGGMALANALPRLENRLTLPALRMVPPPCSAVREELSVRDATVRSASWMVCETPAPAAAVGGGGGGSTAAPQLQ
jgi:hypothetical protein